MENLAIAADRFDTAGFLGECLYKGNMHLRPKGLKYPLDEEVLRQRLLIGLLLNDIESVRAHSKDMILSGSKYWSAAASELPNDALWWDLPRNMEGKDLPVTPGWLSY